MGFNQRDYDQAPFLRALPPREVVTGECSVQNVPNSFFLVGSGAYLSNANGGACAFASGEHLYSCGGSQALYSRLSPRSTMPSGLRVSGFCPCGIKAPAQSWRGPKVSVTWPGGKPKLQVGSKTYDPYWLALNVQGLQNAGPGRPLDWSAFDLSVQKAAQYGLPILEVNLGWMGWVGSLEEYASHLRNGPYYIIVRIGLYHDADKNSSYAPIGMLRPYEGQRIIRKNLNGNSVEDAAYDTYSDEWIAYNKQVIKNVAREMDRLLPGRIIGIKPGYLSTNEQFLRPFKINPNGSQEDTATPSVAYFADYSAEQSQKFCKWSGLPADLTASCVLSVPYFRNRPTFGENFIQASDIQAKKSHL